MGNSPSNNEHMTLNNDAKYYLSPLLNGSHIHDIVTSDSLKFSDDTKIIAFYSVTEIVGHGYIIFKDNHAHAYRCHLTGTPGNLVIETGKTTWKPDSVVKVYSSSKSTNDLKRFFDKQMNIFGEYNSINNNCVTFAQNIGLFLSHNSTF